MKNCGLVNQNVGKTHDDTLCTYLFVDGWKIDVITDATTGNVFQNESFIGPELMGGNGEQMFLGDIIFSIKSHNKNK